MLEIKFSELKGKVFKDVRKAADDSLIFELENGDFYELYHSQNCCENVIIDDICGELSDLIGSEILIAEESVSEDKNPDGVEIPDYQDSFTWTFYKLATKKGYVDIRWYGESNGYYSESVDFRFQKKED